MSLQNRLKCEYGYTNTYVESAEELDHSKRWWWCDNCGAVRKRQPMTKRYAFCSNCEHRHAVLIEMQPVGIDTDKIE